MVYYETHHDKMKNRDARRADRIAGHFGSPGGKWICDTPHALKRGGFFGHPCVSGTRSARGVAATPLRP
jgi:hypothetical protein